MAEAQDSLDVSELKDHFLECSVCLEHFDQAERCPRLLVNCLHSFCSQCLEQLLKEEGRGQVTCPNCRQVQKVKGNAQSLPIDPVRNKLVDYVKFKKGKQIPCTDCPDGSHAVARCHECQIYMCAPCKEAHHRNRSTRKHTCQSLKEALSEPVKNFLSHRCEDHPDYKIEFFCRQCSSLCCVSCPIVKHKGHDLDPIEDAANSMLSSLKTKMEEVEKSASVLRRKKTSLKEKSIVQKVDLKHTTTSINKTFDELIGKFNCQRNKLITELKERTESTVNSLEKQLEATEDSLAQMESTLEYFKQMESKSDDCEVLSAGPVLVKSLEAAAAVDQTQDVQHPTWTFSPGEMNNVISMVQRTGEIHSDTASRSESFQMSDPSQSGASSSGHQASSVGPKVDVEALIVEVDAEKIGKLGYCKKMLSCHDLPVDLNEDTLSNYVEVCGDCEVKKLEFSLDQRAALVTVNNEPDWEKLTKMSKTTQLENKKIRFERLLPSRTICVLFNQADERSMQKFYTNLTLKPKDTSTVKRGQDIFHVITFSSPDDVEAVLRKKDQLAKEYKMLMSVYFESIGPVQEKSELVSEAEVELTVGQSQLLLTTRKLEGMRTYVDIYMKNKRMVVIKGKPKAVSHMKVVIQDFKKQLKEREVECSKIKQKYLLDETCGQLMHLRMRGKNIEGTWYKSRRQLMICATSDADLKHIANWIDRHLKEKLFDSSSEEFKQALKAMGHMEDGSYLLEYGNFHRELVLVAQHEEFPEACQIVDCILAQRRNKEEMMQRKQNERSRTSLKESIKETVTKYHKLFLQRFRQKDLKALETKFNVSISFKGPENEVIISGQVTEEALKSFKVIVRDLKMDILPLSPESSTQILSSGFLGCLEKFVGDTERCVISHKIQPLANESADESLEGAVGGASWGHRSGHSSGHTSGHGYSNFRERGKGSSSPEHKIPKRVVRNKRTFQKQIQFIVKEGEIAKEKSDIIVNTVSKGFDMKAGAVSKSLFAAGGWKFEKEFKDEKYKLHEGGYVVTAGGNLKCKYVFHCCLFPSSSVHAGECLQNVMSEMLKYADSLKSKTVSFPALGTGLLGYPPESSANIMYSAVMEYSRKNQNIEEVRIVIYKNEKAFKAFQVVQNVGCHGSDFKRGKRSIAEVKVGEIAKEKVDVIVNTSNSTLQLGTGAVSKSLLKEAGDKLQKECDKVMKKESMLLNWQFVHTGPGDLDCKRVYHCNMPSYPGSTYAFKEAERRAVSGGRTEEPRSWTSPPSPTPVVPPRKERFKVGSIPVVVKQGDLSQEPLEAVVNPMDASLSIKNSQPVSMTESETERGQITFTITSDEQPLILNAMKVLSDFCKDSWVVGMLLLPPSITMKDITAIGLRNDKVQMRDISKPGKKTIWFKGKSYDVLKAINEFHRQFKTEFADWKPGDSPDQFDESDFDESHHATPQYTLPKENRSWSSPSTSSHLPVKPFHHSFHEKFETSSQDRGNQA